MNNLKQALINENGDKSIALTIYGQCYSKSNSRIFSYNNGRPMLFKNKDVLQYVADSYQQLNLITGGFEPFSGDIKMDITIYYRSKRSDLDETLIQDILQQKIDKKTGQVIFKGLYLNDRQIVERHAYKRLDKENPRVVVKITEI